jgi:polysaccharide export outer membrane protein
MKIFTFALIIFLTACGTAPVAPSSGSGSVTASDKSPAPVPENVTASDKTPMPAATASTEIYLIQPGDLLLIDVWKEKELQREVTVRPDGGLNFPLVGDLDASGKTTEQLQKEIATKLAKYVPDPVVTISVRQSLGNVIYVVGKVNKPGNYAVNRTTDVMQALSMAGGLSPYAAENKIKILRREHGVLKSIPFKYSRVEKGQDLEQNIILQGGDVVVVP